MPTWFSEVSHFIWGPGSATTWHSDLCEDYDKVKKFGVCFQGHTVLFEEPRVGDNETASREACAPAWGGLGQAWSFLVETRLTVSACQPLAVEVRVGAMWLAGRWPVCNDWQEAVRTGPWFSEHQACVWPAGPLISHPAAQPPGENR